MVLPKWSERVRSSAQMLQSTSLPQWERKMAKQVSNPDLLCQPLQGWSQCTWELCQKAFRNTLWQLLQTAGEAGARNRKPKQTLVAKGIKKAPRFQRLPGLSSSPSSCRRGTTTPPTETDPAGVRDLAMDEDRRIHMRLARLKQLGMSLESQSDW